MTELDLGNFWLSVAASFISIVLAVVAIIFTWVVHRNNSALNQRFTEVLTSIDEKSANTQGQISSMVTRIVDAFLEVKQSEQPLTADIVDRLADESGGGVPPSSDALREIRLELARMAQGIEEVKLRQRVQAPATSHSGLGWDGSGRYIFEEGDRVRVTCGAWHDRVGTVMDRRLTARGGLRVYTIQFDDGETRRLGEGVLETREDLSD